MQDTAKCQQRMFGIVPMPYHFFSEQNAQFEICILNNCLIYNPFMIAITIRVWVEW